MQPRKSAENFVSALAALQRFLETPVEDERARSGVIHAFELAFETAWKAWQDELAELGVATGSPKKTLAEAFAQGWIEPADEQAWLQMLSDRNLTTHAYREEIAQKVFEHIQSVYVDLLTNACDGIRDRST